MDKIRASQLECPELHEVIKCLQENKQIEAGPFRSYNNLQIIGGLLHKGLRVIVPDDCQEAIIKELHGQHHVGAPNTLELCKNRFYWRGMKQHIFSLIEKCETCLQCKTSGTLRANLVIPEIRPPREMLAMDVGSFPPSKKGNDCFLMMLDSNTKFMAVEAMKGQKAEVVKSALWNKWFPYMGVPGILLSDQAKNMDGKVVRQLCKDLGIEKIRSSAYHPHGNGSAERAIATLKMIMRSIIHSRNLDLSDWDEILPEAVLAANNTVNKSTQYSPFMTMWGTRPRMPVDCLLELPVPKDEVIEPEIIQKNADMNRKEAQANYKRLYDKTAKPVSYEIGQEVLLKKNFGKHLKASVRWEKGPYFVTKKMGPANFGVEGPNGFSKLLHHDKIRPARSSVEATKTPTLHQPSTDVEYDLVEFRMPIRSETLPVTTPVGPTATSLPTAPSPPMATSPLPTPPPTSPMTTPLRLPYPELLSNAFSTRTETNNLILDQQAFTENVFAQTEIDNNIEDSFYDNAVEDNIMNDYRDFEAPAISNEEISNMTNNRVITRRMRNILGDSEEFLALP